MTLLEKEIIAQIEQNGPLSISKYMDLCLNHPKFGYYSTGTPIGALGDFITAPEISQLFGEMVGLWLVNQWNTQGKPEKVTLVEIGPGKGTLMSDILRVSLKFEGFGNALHVVLVENSPTLAKHQKATLGEIFQRISWDTALPISFDSPVFFVANELFDALPIDQFVKTDFGWSEIQVGLRDGQLNRVLAKPVGKEPLDTRYLNLETGRIVETSALSDSISANMGQTIRKHGGGALIIDYGSWEGVGDTLQAVKSHEMVGFLNTPGEADLTAHVDFSRIVNKSRCLYKFTNQGNFLENMGISARAQILASDLEGDMLLELVSAHRRLTHPDEMGELFKVLALLPGEQEFTAGFS